MSNEIHPLASVAKGARLGKGNVIGPFAVIEEDVVLGDNNRLHGHAMLRNGTRLGEGNVVHPFAVLGGEPQDLGFKGFDSQVVVGDRNTFRESVTVHRSTQQDGITRIGNDCFLMANVHIGHDCILADHVVVAPSSGLGGFVEVEERAFISGGVMVHQFCHIGRNAMIGGNAKVIKDALPFYITDGTPARVRGVNLIGLRRSGFSADEIRDIRRAYRILLRSGLSLREALACLRENESPWVAHLCEFISRSRRSFHRVARERDRQSREGNSE